MSRRLLAMAALVVGAATIVLALWVAVSEFPRGLLLLGCILVAVAAAWYGLLRRGAVRVVGLLVAALALVGGTVLLLTRGAPLADVLIVVGALLSLGAASAAFTRHVDLPSVPAPRHPVLFFNPRSGGGKAERFALAVEARKRGIKAIKLNTGDDLEALVRAAVADGADGLAMAGGDGSQAVVATIASDLDLPYACIPAGTRNHFALDLGVDRDDVVGALDAFVDGGEQRVDLGDVNGRVFVNNVSLGLYAETVNMPATATPRSARCWTPCPTYSARTVAAWTSAGGDQVGTSTAEEPRCWCPTTPTVSAARSDRALGPGSTKANSGSPSSARSPGRTWTAARCSGHGGHGRHRPSWSTPSTPFRPAWTARPSDWTRR